MEGVKHTTCIAIVEDDVAVRESVADLVRSEGYEAATFGDAATFLVALNAPIAFDLIVLDLMLPDRDGLSLASMIRVTNQVPIIILSGRGQEVDRIVGLEIGADDYLVKPFSPRELLARIKAVMRRLARDVPGPAKSAGEPDDARITFAGYVLDLERRRLTAPSGCEIILTVAEFDLLAALVGASGRVLTRDQLLNVMHRSDRDVYDRTIDVLILRLRRKIEPTPQSPRFIRTERGVGYVFDIPGDRARSS